MFTRPGEKHYWRYFGRLLTNMPNKIGGFIWWWKDVKRVLAIQKKTRNNRTLSLLFYLRPLISHSLSTPVLVSWLLRESEYKKQGRLTLQMSIATFWLSKTKGTLYVFATSWTLITCCWREEEEQEEGKKKEGEKNLQYTHQTTACKHKGSRLSPQDIAHSTWDSQVDRSE